MLLESILIIIIYEMEWGLQEMGKHRIDRCVMGLGWQVEILWQSHHMLASCYSLIISKKCFHFKNIKLQ